MKDFKKPSAALISVLIICLAFSNGCKEQESDKLVTPQITDLKLNVDYPVTSKNKLLRLSPGLSVSVKESFTENAYKIPKGIEKMASILKEDESRKNRKTPIATTSAVNFTATLAGGGNFYNCYGELDEPGSTAWWLINTYTWVMTPLGTTPDNYIYFYVNTPSMYGSYRLWGENTNNYIGGYTGYQYMGQPYSGVSISSGVLEFTTVSAMNTILDRLKAAMETHITNFVTPLEYMSDDDINDQALYSGFDEFLPLREFEAHFGLNSLRQKIETEENAWLNSSSDPWLISVNPDDKYAIDDIYERTINNQYSQVKVNSILYQPVNAIELPSSPSVSGCNSGGTYFSTVQCIEDGKVTGWQDLPGNKKIHWKVKKERGSGESGGNTVFKAYFKGKVRCYAKRSGWTIFSKRMTRMSADIAGTVYTSDGYSSCANLYENFTNSKSYKRVYHRDIEKYWNVYKNILSCQAWGTFNVNGTTFTKYLE